MAGKKPAEDVNMAGKHAAKKESVPMFGVALKTAFAVFAAGGLIWVLVSAGQRAGQDVSKEQRYAVPFSSLEVAPPPNTTQKDFLSEVRYLSRVPETVQSVSAETPPLLKAAFQKHPWVKEVRDVIVRPDGQITVNLVYRTPALVIYPQSEADQLRVLDTDGVLLPQSASTTGLARLVNRAKGVGVAGELWPDADVIRAAELSQTPEAQTIEKKGSEWIVTQKNGRVLRIPAPVKPAGSP